MEQLETEIFPEGAATAPLSDADAAELADLLLFEDHQDTEVQENQVRPEIVDKAVKRLKEDAVRAEGSIDRDDVNRTYTKLRLTISECAEAEKLLHAAQIRIADDEVDVDSDSSSSGAPRSAFLSEADERALARKIQLANRIAAEQNSATNEFSERGLADADRARELFVSTNQRYVRKLAHRYKRTKHLTNDDIYQEGMLGLLRAIDTFDPDLGFRFKTYATWWIQQRISRSIANDDREVRLPVHLHEQLRKIKRSQAKYLLAMGRLPDTKQLADAVGMAPERLARLLWRVQATDCVEGDAIVGEDATVFSFVPDELAISQLDAVERQELSAQTREALHTLTPREERILRLRFGFETDEPQTLEAIGNQFYLTRERIRQIEAKALRKLKHPSRSRKLRSFLD